MTPDQAETLVDKLEELVKRIVEEQGSVDPRSYLNLITTKKELSELLIEVKHS